MKLTHRKVGFFVIAAFMGIVVFSILNVAWADSPKMSLKSGDEAYVCACGPACDCMTMSMKPGNCVCNRPMVKAKVAYVEGDWAVMKIAEGNSGYSLQAFKAQGKYACACGSGCTCNTVSQKEGKCACGKEMKKVN